MTRDEQYQMILAVLEPHERGLTFSEIQRGTGLHPQTVQRRLRELIRRKAVAHSEGRYVLLDPGLAATLEIINLIRTLGSMDIFGGPRSDSREPMRRAVLRATRVQTYPGLGVDFYEARLKIVEALLARVATLKRRPFPGKIAVTILIDTERLRAELSEHPRRTAESRGTR